jgi:hypothetical protein
MTGAKNEHALLEPTIFPFDPQNQGAMIEVKV